MLPGFSLLLKINKEARPNKWHKIIKPIVRKVDFKLNLVRGLLSKDKRLKNKIIRKIIIIIKSL